MFISVNSILVSIREEYLGIFVTGLGDFLSYTNRNPDIALPSL